MGAAALVAAFGFAAPALAGSMGFQAGAGKLSLRARTSPFASSKSIAAYQSRSETTLGANLTTTIVVPAVKRCGSSETEVIPYVGAFGTKESAAGLAIECLHGKAHYFPIFNNNGTVTAVSSATAHPGDKVTLRLRWTTTKLSLDVVDKTHPSVTRNETGSGSSTFSYATIGDSTIESPPLPIPHFGKVTFSRSKIGGRGVGLAPGLRRYNLVSSSDVLEIKTGPIANNESFTTTFKHS